MMNSPKPYQSYKDSGTAWLGRVPAHWEILPNRALFTEVKDRDHPDEPMLSVTITRGVIPQRALLEDTSKKDGSNLDRSAYKLVQPGDIAYNKMRAWQGAIGLSELRGIISPAYVVQRPRSKDANRFFHFLFRTPQFAKEAERWSYGITSDMWSLRPEHFRMIYTPLPPPEEREAIVRFLDHYDRLIRRFIVAKRKLIALLTEQKQAIIHHAVTRGIDSGVPLKSSDTPYLGDVPSHWEVVRFKRRVGFQEGPGIMAADFRDEGVPLLRISCLSGDIATLDGCNFLDPDMVKRRWSHFAVHSGDYLLSASASTGKVVLANHEVAGAIPYTGILRLWPISQNTFMPFVRFFIMSQPFQDQIDEAKSGVGIEHFGPTHLKRMFIALPPVSEQKRIVDRLMDQLAQYDTLSRAVHAQIALLSEFRTRIVADVVTGKYDVREAARSLPELPSESSQEQLDRSETGENIDLGEDEVAMEQITKDYAD